MEIITRELWVDGPNGRIYGELYLPESGDGTRAREPLPCIVCSHGFNSTHASPARYGRRLVKAGFGCAFAHDFCGGGEGSRSDGSMLEMSILTERADLMAVLDAVRNLPEVDEGRIILEGHSQGGLVSALVAADRPADIAAMMLLYPAFMIPEAVKRMVPSRDEIPERGEALGAEVGRAYVDDAWDVDAFAAAAAYSGPVAIFQGTDDAIVPPETARKLAELYPDAQLMMLDGEGHGFTDGGQDIVFSAMCDFLA